MLNDSATFHLYFTALDSSDTKSIGYSSTPENGVSKLPDNSSWSARSQLLDGDGSGFDASGVAHPSVVKDGATYVMYYTGLDSSGNSKIGRATAASANGPFTSGAAAVVDVGLAGDFDAGSVKDPVVVKAGAGDYRMLYTGVETLEGETIERVGYATSADGISWTKRGVVLGPSLTAYGYDEVGVEPAGMLIDGSTMHLGRAASTAPVAHAAVMPRRHIRPRCRAGRSPERLGDLSARRRVDHEPRFSPDRPYLDRQLRRALGQLPPALFVERQRVLVRLLPCHRGEPDRGAELPAHRPGGSLAGAPPGPSGSPALEKVEIMHAPVSFSPTGSAVSTSIGPSPGRPSLPGGASPQR